MDYKISDEIYLSLKPLIDINKIIYTRKGGCLGGAEIEGIYEEAIFTNKQYRKLTKSIPVIIGLLNDKYGTFTLIEELNNDKITTVTLSGEKDSKQVCFIYKIKEIYKNKIVNSFHHWLFKEDLLKISNL
jgi:hypothetical protein